VRLPEAMLKGGIVNFNVHLPNLDARTCRNLFCGAAFLILIWMLMLWTIPADFLIFMYKWPFITNMPILAILFVGASITGTSVTAVQ
jgi:hypothetical protein